MRNIAAKFLDTASRLSYELGIHGEKKNQWKLWTIIKNGHSKDDTFQY